MRFAFYGAFFFQCVALAVALLNRRELWWINDAFMATGLICMLVFTFRPEQYAGQLNGVPKPVLDILRVSFAIIAMFAIVGQYWLDSWHGVRLIQVFAFAITVSLLISVARLRSAQKAEAT